MLRLAHGHSRHHTELHRLVRCGDDLLFPVADHDGTPIQIPPLGELEMPD